MLENYWKIIGELFDRLAQLLAAVVRTCVKL